jgi:hypothetical protein
VIRSSVRASSVRCSFFCDSFFEDGAAGSWERQSQVRIDDCTRPTCGETTRSIVPVGAETSASRQQPPQRPACLDEQHERGPDSHAEASPRPEKIPNIAKNAMKRSR